MGNRPDIRNAKDHRRSSISESVSDCSTHQSLTRLECANPYRKLVFRLRRQLHLGYLKSAVLRLVLFASKANRWL